MKETGILRLLNVASLITLTGLALAMAAILAVISGMPEISVILMYLSIWCDRLDGLVARKLNKVSDFGAELDNLSDAIAFGAAPAIFIYAVTRNPWTIPFALLITFAGVLRLARYSYVGLIERNEKKYFVGLPIPYSSALLFLIWAIVREFAPPIQSAALSAFAVIVSYFMISAIPIRKGSTFERWSFYIVYPLVFIYYILCLMGIRF